MRLMSLTIDQTSMVLLLIESVFGLILDMAGLAQSSAGSSTSTQKKNETVSAQKMMRSFCLQQVDYDSAPLVAWFVS